MTREEAINQLKDFIILHRGEHGWDVSTLNALDMAIKALEQTSTLDKIRAEIEETYMNITYQENKDRKATWGLRKALQIIDEHKAESEGVE